ncbi:hypothetical protein [Halobacillus litoralis]|uniref:hypothetical protein n=1 Tax=Halobacillus litoralis TaxID=45668 RepID=UPI00136EE07C|nr:hypothetical protein [Halobacillus litoralis]MYL36410.1 hypothetical protein [Halobacillus litoralis]
MTDSLKKEYLILPTSTSSIYIEFLGQNPVMAMTTWKRIYIKAEATTKTEVIHEILTMIKESP